MSILFDSGEKKFMLRKRGLIVIWAAILMLVLLAGCKKKPPPAPPPPPPVVTKEPPPPPAPSAPVINEFSAEPGSIDRGQSSTLKWSVGNATEISIDQGIGAVQANGTRRVFPSDSTIYRLTARGPGGNASATASVNVAAPPPAAPPPSVTKEDIGTRLSKEVQDAYFDYDSNSIRADARNVLQQDADALKRILNDFPNASIVVEGHCDERGSAEYNLGLGDRRATAAKDFLVQLGVPADRLKTISYGKERPQCTESNEDCWQKNRRAHFATGQ